MTSGALAYVDVAYARENSLSTASVRNAAGIFTAPTLEAIGAAAATIKGQAIAPSGAISIVDPARSAPNAYPICTFTYVILPESSKSAEPLKTFVSYALGAGQAEGPPLLFRPLPPAVSAFGRDQLAKIGP